MNCPSCNEELVEGCAEVHGTAGGMLLFGLSHQHLWWYPPEGKSARDIVLRSNRSMQAFRCGSCGTMVLPFHANPERSS